MNLYTLVIFNSFYHHLPWFLCLCFSNIFFPSSHPSESAPNIQQKEMNSFQKFSFAQFFSTSNVYYFYAKSKVDLCKARRKTHHTTVSTQNGGLFQSFEPFNVLYIYLFIYLYKKNERLIEL